jgi:catechol 2,3-dioxygenase-like lactoylglutathione lyase family enzyme
VAVIDHFGLNCANFEEAKAFYDEVLDVLGYTRQMDFGAAIGYGRDGHPDFWIADGKDMGPNREIHVAFRAANSDAVKAFYDAATQLGPQPRSDPDGNNVEAVFHGGSPETA